MKLFSAKKGVTMIDYVLTTVLVGLIIGYAMSQIKPETLTKFFRGSLSNSTQSGDKITVNPID